MSDQDSTSTLATRAWNGYYTSRMNVHYYQRLIGWWKNVGFWMQAGTALCSSAALLSTVTRLGGESGPWIVGVSSGVAAAIGVVLMILRPGDRVNTLIGLLIEYKRHSGAFDRLLARSDAGDLQAAEVEGAEDALRGTMVQESPHDPAPSRQWLEHAQNIVNQEAGSV